MDPFTAEAGKQSLMLEYCDMPGDVFWGDNYQVHHMEKGPYYHLEGHRLDKLGHLASDTTMIPRNPADISNKRFRTPSHLFLLSFH